MACTSARSVMGKTLARAVWAGLHYRRVEVVPLDLIDSTAGDIRLRCTVEEFGNLEPAEETELIDDVTGRRPAASRQRVNGAAS